MPTTGTVQVAVQTGSRTTPNFRLTLATASPGIYYVQDPSTATRFNILAQLNQTAWLNMPARMAAALNEANPGVTCLCQASASALSICGQPASGQV